MFDKRSIWDTRRGWIFCLNAPPEKGSRNWGFVEDFYRSFGHSSMLENGLFTMESKVWGKPYSKQLRLQHGDGLIFYHGKKARLGSGPTKKNRHIKPYQLSLWAGIEAVQQDESTGQVCAPSKHVGPIDLIH